MMKRLVALVVVLVVGATVSIGVSAAPVVGQATRGSGLCDAGGITQFSDVGDSDYAAAYILCMRALGLSYGFGDGSYGPGRELNRGQMAAFLTRLWTEQLGRQCPSGLVSPFTDTAGNIHEADIDCLYGLGITKGTSATTYSPRDRLKASQISRFLYRTYQNAGGDQCAGSAGSELDRAAECLVGLRVAPTTGEATSVTPVTRAQMGVYVIGLWHNLTGRGLPPVPPQLSTPTPTPTITTTTTTAPTATVPGVPFIWRALPGNGRILIEWSVPADDGGSPITGYTVSFDNGRGHSGKLTVSDTMATISDLTNDATYTIKVTADNTLGSGPPAATTLVPSETNTVPGPPVLRVTQDGPGWVSVEWGPPADDGGSPVHCYFISYNGGPEDGWCNTSNNQFSINLEAGVTYTFEATASNRFGSGWPARATIVPTGTWVEFVNTPVVTASVSGRTVTATWSTNGPHGYWEVDGVGHFEPEVTSYTWRPRGSGLVEDFVVRVRAGGAGHSRRSEWGISNAVTLPVLPKVAVSASAPTFVEGDFEVAITFDRPVTGLELSDIRVVNGDATDLTGAGADYRATITPAAAGTVMVRVPVGAVHDTASSSIFNAASNPLFRVRIGDDRTARPGLDTWDRAAVVRSYTTEFDRTEPDMGFTGDVENCVAGTTSQAYRDSMVRRVNWFRHLAGVGAVTENPTMSVRAQEAALIMSANGELSHYPGEDWACYTESGYLGAARSNLATVTGHRAINAWMQSAGHRRGTIDPTVDEMGLGNVPPSPRVTTSFGGGALDVISGINASRSSERVIVREERGFVAWPPPGYHPLLYEYGARGRIRPFDTSLSWSEWSFLPPSGADVSNATVTVSDHTRSFQVRSRLRGGRLLYWSFFPYPSPIGGESFTWRAGPTQHPRDSSYEDHIADFAGDVCYTVTISGVTIDGVVQAPYEYPVCLIDPDSSTGSG